MKSVTAHRLYILMRSDLPSMNPGRGMAQSAHAANLFIFKHGNDIHVKNWQRVNGFGTTICLSATKNEVERVVKSAKRKNLMAGLVYDPTYKYSLHPEIAELIDRRTFTAAAILKEDGQWVLFRKELTCGYMFIEDDSTEREELVGDLPLQP